MSESVILDWTKDLGELELDNEPSREESYHRLSDVDLAARTCTCRLCGPVKIHLRGCGRSPACAVARARTRLTHRTGPAQNELLTKERERRQVAKRRAVQFVNEIKLARGCVDCGYNEHPEALDFDHLRDKTKNVSTLATQSGTVSWVRLQARLEAEIAKCEVVCANCHRIRTFRRRKGAQ